MRFLSLSDTINSTLFFIFYFSVIVLTIIKDEHYLCRIRVGKGIRKLFFNKLRCETIPLIAVATALEILVTFPILLVIKLSSARLDLTAMLVKYLFLPWLCLIIIISLIELIIYISQKINVKKKEKIYRQRYTEQKHVNTKKSSNIKKKKSKRM
jgi:hypothetical protein